MFTQCNGQFPLRNGVKKNIKNTKIKKQTNNGVTNSHMLILVVHCSYFNVQTVNKLAGATTSINKVRVRFCDEGKFRVVGFRF